MRTKIYYTSDVSIEEHSAFIVFDNPHNNQIDAIYIVRDEDSPKIWVHFAELFNNTSDSFLNKDAIESMNKSCDTDYRINQKLTDIDQYLFTLDSISYFGADNFDHYPLVFDNQDEFETWLKEMNLKSNTEIKVDENGNWLRQPLPF